MWLLSDFTISDSHTIVSQCVNKSGKKSEGKEIFWHNWIVFCFIFVVVLFCGAVCGNDIGFYVLEIKSAIKSTQTKVEQESVQSGERKQQK